MTRKKTNPFYDKKTNPLYGYYYKKDRLNQLRGFCITVQNNNSATQASKKIHIEPGTICKQINSLEEEFQIKLFNRTDNNRFILTADGKRLYDKAIKVIQEADNIYQEFSKDMEDERNNLLRIATFDAIIQKMLPHIIIFKEQYPNVNFMFYNISKEEAFDKLLDNELDLVIYPTDENDELPMGIKKDKIIENILNIVVHPSHDIAHIDDKDLTEEVISKYPFGLFSNVVYSKSFKHFIEKYNLEPPINVRYGTINLIKEMIKNNMCIALLDSYYLTNEDKSQLVLRKKPDNFSPMYFYSFYKKEVEHKDLSKKFLELIKEKEKEIFH